MRYNWDDAFANMAHIKGAEALPAQWAAEAAAFRAAYEVEEDILYGLGERQRFDLIPPDGAPKGLVVFVHGGYWMRTSKSDWTQYAAGARDAGWAVAMPSYPLAPQARIAQITQEVGQAITAAAARVDGPIRLVGHSAGGHLVSRMLCADSPLAPKITARLANVVSISGVHDLRPLMKTALNETLGLDRAEAQTESPALLEPQEQARLTAWVGGGERPEFLRQARLLSLIWSGLGARVTHMRDSHHDHFSVLDGLRHPDSDLMRCLLG